MLLVRAIAEAESAAWPNARIKLLRYIAITPFDIRQFAGATNAELAKGCSSVGN
jgi:hypothetical protein